MPYTPARLYQGQPPTAETTIYTVPANTKVIIKQIVLANTVAQDATIGVSLVPSGGSAGSINRIIPSMSIPAGGIVVVDLSQVMNAGDFLSASQNTAGAITVTISGVVVT